MINDPVITAVADEYADVVFFEDDSEPAADPFAQYCPASKALWRYTDEVLKKYVRGTGEGADYRPLS
jgi:hypothetical protein